MTKSEKKKDKKKNLKGAFYRYLAAVLIVVTIITLLLMKRIDVLPGFYFVVVTVILGAIEFVLVKWLIKRNPKRLLSTILSIILIIGMIASIVYEAGTINFLKKLGGAKFKTIAYDVVVLKSDNYKTIDDIKGKYVGVLNTTDKDYKQALSFIEKKVSFDKEKSDDIGDLAEKLLTKEVNAIVVEQSSNSILSEENIEYNDKAKVLYTFEIEVEVTDITKKVDVTKEPFNIYISGIDTYGSVNQVSRSDVNIVVSINPNTHEIRFTSIPRDYYVMLHSKGGKDKLTHAGIYGIDESVNTIEDLLNIDINYFIKVNFSSVIDIVDTIGPITVNSNYTFTTGVYGGVTEPYTFYEGENTLNGKKALAFSRERKAFNGGDRVRNENQQLVLEAIINKILSPKILIKYNDLLDNLSDSFVTNLTEEEITSIVKKQLSDNKEWKISSYVLEGKDDYNYTFSYKSVQVYVMAPDRESINNAIDGINKVLSND